MTSTSSFTKDIFTRLKQINNDIKLLKESQAALVNSRLDEVEQRLTRLESVIENKFDILFEKLNKNITAEVEETNTELLAKLDNIDIITNKVDIKHQPELELEQVLDFDELANIDSVNHDDIDSVNINNNSSIIDNDILILD